MAAAQVAQLADHQKCDFCSTRNWRKCVNWCLYNLAAVSSYIAEAKARVVNKFNKHNFMAPAIAMPDKIQTQ